MVQVNCDHEAMFWSLSQNKLVSLVTKGKGKLLAVTLPPSSLFHLTSKTQVVIHLLQTGEIRREILTVVFNL